jgi:hypothetical protein
MSTAGVSDANLYFNPNTGRLTAQIINGLSDRSIKENIEILSDVSNIINQINPVSFNWKNSGERSYGVIAQDLEKILPELVDTDSRGVKSVSYIPLIAFLIGSVQQLYREIEKINQQSSNK